MPASTGTLLRHARTVRGLSVVDAARAAAISPAYLSRLENNPVKKPSPHVLHQLSQALSVPYPELMRLSDYLMPGGPDQDAPENLNAGLFADLTDDERDEFVDYLAWSRSRRRSRT
ncbi:MAG TPA: helix-turn-helix transcriptional regulator [Candidatus Limnocylindria bacterium]